MEQGKWAELYNPEVKPIGGPFHIFPRLPTKIRLAIWELCLMNRRRLISVQIHPNQSGNMLDEGQSGLPGKSSERKIPRCRLIVEGQQVNSKLFRINRESRSVALRFYRVHVPCQYKRDSTVEGTFYFHPENDILFLKGNQRSSGWDPSTCTYLVHDLLTRDPRNIGLQHIALDDEGVEFIYSTLTPVEAELKQSFRQFLHNIRHVYFVTEMLTKEDLHLLPYKPWIPTFDVERVDARADIAEGLAEYHVYYSDPLTELLSFVSHIRRWERDFKERMSVSYRWLATHRTISSMFSPITDRESAVAQIEQGRKDGGSKILESVAANDGKPVVGWWMFTPEITGRLPAGPSWDDESEWDVYTEDDDLDEWEERVQVKLDMRLPELWVTVLH